MDLFAALAKKWESGAVEDGDILTGFSTHASLNLDVGALLETGRATYEILRSLTRRRLEGLDCIAFLTIDSEGLVAVPQYLFCVTESKYEGRLGSL